jgi:nicotinamide-nucleotide amidase
MENGILQASIITIGDELMIGQVIDTNSAWIAQQMNVNGIWVRKRVSVGDSFSEIWNTLDEESRHSKLIFITGGLGPTADDITKPLLSKYFNSPLVTDEHVLKHVQYLFEVVFKRPFTEVNMKQAEVPASCTVIHNARGTAPGMMFEKNGVIYFSMPGVPHEMKGMMTDKVIPVIKEKIKSGVIIHRTLLTAGIGESFLAEHIKRWESSLPPYIKLAYLPGYGMVRLRLTGTGSDEYELQKEIDENFSTVKQLVKQWLVTDEDISLAQAVSKILKAKRQTVSTTESCTGGYIAHLLTSEAGSSVIYNGSVVCYSNRVKMDLLGVHEQTLNSFGAVSEETVKEMIIGGLKELKTDYCIATSGIMGPDGGTSEKPVGTVWVAAGDKEKITTQKFTFRFDRARNIEMTAIQALNLLRKHIEGIHSSANIR